MAYRSRRENPAETAPGMAGANALNTASTTSSAQWLVLMQTGAGGLALTTSPRGATIWTGRIDPSLRAMSIGARYMMAAWARERVLAYALLMNPSTWGLESLRSMIIESPAMVTLARMGTSLLSKPSSSTNDSPR